jgi:polysaccharide pyruvyl transferase WcaK-like protein
MKRIAIRGSYGARNFGDDALLIAAHQVVRQAFPAAEIVVLGYESDYIERLLPGATVIDPSIHRAGDFDLYVYGGGTQFYSFPNTRSLSLWNRALKNLKRPAAIPGKLVRKIQRRSDGGRVLRKAALGVGAGPFVAGSAEIDMTRQLFAGMDYIAVRDVSSYERCASWGCDNLVLRSDLCYFPGIWESGIAISETAQPKSGIERIGVIPRDWPHTGEGESYTGPLLETVDILRAAGKEVEFISFSQRHDGEWLSRLADRNEPCHLWNPDEQTILEFLNLLSYYDAFITARYHGAVFASLLGKPFVGIEVEQKLRLICELFGDGARLWRYPFDVSESVYQISDLDREYSNATEQLGDVVSRQRALAVKMAAELS